MPCYTHKMAIVFVAVDFVTSFHHMYKGTFLWNFVQNSRLRKFRHGISIVETCYRLIATTLNARINDKPNSRQSVDNTYELRRSTANLSQWSSNSVYILQKRFRRESLTSTTNSLLCNSTADDCPLISKIFCLQHDEIKISAAEMFPCPSIER